VPVAAPDRDNVNIDRARALWREATEIKWSLAAIYLARRCPPLDDNRDWHGVLRFHPECPFGKDRAPAMGALMRDIATNEGCGIQRWLSPDGRRLNGCGQPRAPRSRSIGLVRHE
jgi:hypothetical protein